MFKKEDKNKNRIIRHKRVRKKISGTTERPRLCVYRSLSGIYAQIIDDTKGITLVSASTQNKKSDAVVKKLKGKTKKEQAQVIGKTIAELAIKKGITEVVFDRGGYIYTGRVQALAEAAREAGLKF